MEHHFVEILSKIVMDIVFFLFKTEISIKTPPVGDHRGLMMRSDVVD